MIYFCLSPSSQPSSRCIINVENPPSPHALLRHEDGDFDLSCRLLIKMCCGFFCCCCCFTQALLHFENQHSFADTIMTGSFLLMVVFIFDTAESLESKLTQCRSLSSQCLSTPQQVTALIPPAGCFTLSFTHPHCEQMPSALLCSTLAITYTIYTLYKICTIDC